MRFHRHDARLGLLVLAAVVLFAGLAFHRTLRLLVTRENVHAVRLPEASDLAAGADVQLLGMRVGRVRALAMEREGVEYRFVATIALRSDIVLWRGTKGVVTARMMGGPFLDLRLPPVAARRERLAPGEPIEGESGASPATLVAEVAVLTRTLNDTVAELRSELKTRGLASFLEQPDVKRAFGEYHAAMRSFERATASAEAAFASGAEAMRGVERNTENFRQTWAGMQELLERRGPELEKALEELGPALAQMEAAGAELQATLKSAGPRTEESLRALQRTLRSTQELVELLKAKPNRLVFGTPSEKEQEAARKKVDAPRVKE